MLAGLIRSARDGDNAAREVATDALLERGYTAQRIARVFAPYSPEIVDRMLVCLWPEAMRIARDLHRPGVVVRPLALQTMFSLAFPNRTTDLPTLVERATESCLAREWLARSRRGLRITRKGSAAAMRMTPDLADAIRTGTPPIRGATP